MRLLTTAYRKGVNRLARRDHQPYWLMQIFNWINQRYINIFLTPQFESVGKDFRAINPRFLEVSGPNISIEDHVHFMALRDKPVRLAVFEGLGRISIGSYSIINPGVRISSADAIEIGQSCMLAMNCYLSDADWHDIHHRIYAPGAHKPIKLGNNVWIGDSALVCKGVTIGDNSIVGAWSVVTKDVPANVIVAGNPARVVRSLDTSHLTTRAHLFNMPQPYAEFEQDMFRTRLAGNSLAGWLKSKLWPDKQD